VDWKAYSGGAILGQMKRLGDSVDWNRTYFTMDEALSKVVVETFVQLYEQGLIYRGQRLSTGTKAADRGVGPRGGERRGRRPVVGDPLPGRRRRRRSGGGDHAAETLLATSRWQCIRATSATRRWSAGRCCCR